MYYQIGYTGDISLLSKFKKPFLPPMWNGLFTLLFKSFSERVAGSDNASKLFYTLIYGLFHGFNLDYGAILWTQLIQSTFTTTQHAEISYARFWSIVVNRALSHFNVKLMLDSVMAPTPILQLTTFVMSGPKNFTFIGSIPKEMLVKVPNDNVIVYEYQKLSSSVVRPMLDDLRRLIDEGNKLKWGGKQKAKASPSETAQALNKINKKAKKPRSPSPVTQEDSESITVT